MWKWVSTTFADSPHLCWWWLLCSFICSAISHVGWALNWWFVSISNFFGGECVYFGYIESIIHIWVNDTSWSKSSQASPFQQYMLDVNVMAEHMDQQSQCVRLVCLLAPTVVTHVTHGGWEHLVSNQIAGLSHAWVMGLMGWYVAAGAPDGWQLSLLVPSGGGCHGATVSLLAVCS